MYLGVMPKQWAKVSYPTMRSLASFIKDLNQRMRMLKQWIESGEAPAVFWLPGFYFPHSFLTAILQAHATKMQIPINTLTLDFKYSATTILPDNEGCVMKDQFEP